MIRVTQTENELCTEVTIDGHLAGDGVSVVETCCKQAQSCGKPVHVFLRDVAAVDAAGKTLLRKLASTGVSLRASGVYTSYLVQALTLGVAAAQGLSVES